ncbi:nucleolar MIF4G domain-containing protein 1 homolog [Condylostylus longicornis]|uniref:nucleolar MIF4G domain-containing protein 1 homolog n=1 Tax=Condylostylus longicornis TaxID=2530218 RepID=UPI00244DA836|nr:nucleolar MIF4G domain-containing protein 1 homolog [Condylostylus longicornis]
MAKARKKIKKKIGTKSRLEQRKEKRLKKKENKREFFSRKRKTKNPDRNTNEIKHSNSNNELTSNDNEIESDFELSDDELNSKLSVITKKKSVLKKDKANSIKVESKNKVIFDRFLENQNREKKKQKELEAKMKKRRIIQLDEANEDEDKVIKKLEKKLGINKHANDKSVHKMFSDGLDYALELCLPENIDKMYSAAKEAAEIQENESENEFQDDLLVALGGNENLNDVNKKKQTKINGKNTIPKKAKNYNTDSDLDDFDSELENEIDNKNTGNDTEESLNEHQSKLGEESSNEDELNEESSNENEDEVNEESSNEDEQHERSCDDEVEDALKEENSSEDVLNQESCSDITLNDESYNKDTNDKKKIWEDIYGRKRDADGKILQVKNEKYIPPHVRDQMNYDQIKDPKKKEKLDKLKRQVKGLLNRLTESNIIKISKDIESLYRNNSRFDMNNIFSELLFSAIVSNILSKERMVLEYTMLIAILHVNVGNEISAHLLENLIVKFEKLVDNITTLDIEDKELDNIVLILSHMYTYKIFHYSLVYEIINRLNSNLCEKSVECILIIFKAVGFQMRKDDPLALRDVILSIQKKSDEIGAHIQNNSRFKFMIEILKAIKNNNMYKIPQYDPSLAEHFKKILKNMFKDGKYLSTLNITRNDLLNADKKGKWWVVGSAWSGNIKDIGVSQHSEEKSGNKRENFAEHLLELAKKQRMNTDDRRNIFCIIMGSEDYLDAFDKLLHLSVKDIRLIVSIIIHCCLSEKQFNPYYAVLAEKFCSHDRKYMVAIQFAIWDRIKDINSLNKHQIENLAKLVLHLIKKGSQSISILKIVEFTELDKITLRFVRIIVLGILLGDENEMLQIFKRIAPSAALNNFKSAIVLFIRHFLLKGTGKNYVANDQIEILNQRIDAVEGIIFNKNFI